MSQSRKDETSRTAPRSVDLRRSPYLTVWALGAALAAACSGGGGGSPSLLPPPGPIASNSPLTATLSISVPKRSRAASRAERLGPSYVSPATQSLSVKIVSAATKETAFSRTVNLTPESPGCTTTVAATVCRIAILILPGAYLVDVATYSGLNGTGSVLSQGQDESVTIAQGKSNAIGLTLYGIPASVRVQAVSTFVGGSQKSGFTLSGIYPDPRVFNVVALDAAGNTIVGTGSPSFSVASSNAAFSISPPTAQASNTFSVTPVGTQDATASLTVRASFADATTCKQSDAACSAKVGVNFDPFAADDWITFAHDFRRTGEQTQETGLTVATVPGLKQRWAVKLPAGVYASPLVYKGNVIVSTRAGTVYDLSADTGAIIWSANVPATQFPQSGKGALTLDTDDGLILVGENPPNTPEPSPVAALRVTDGDLAWQETLPGLVRSAAVYAGGRFYEGWSGGDRPGCINGGVTALDARTGAQDWTWLTNPILNPGGGGGIWGAIGYDGTNLYFGTGNTCSVTADMQGAAAVSLSGTTVWSFVADPDVNDDSDTGSSVMLENGTATLMNKNGSLYNLEAATGKVNWSTPLGAVNGMGGFASPGGDGSTIVVGAGFFPEEGSARGPESGRVSCPIRSSPNRIMPGYTSKLVGVGTTGEVRWTIAMQNGIVNSATVSDGIAWEGMDTRMDAIDIHTGSILWSFSDPSAVRFDAGAIVVPSGLYIADREGTVYALSLPAASASSASRPGK